MAAPTASEEKPPPPVAYAAKGRRDPFRPPVREVEAKGGLAIAGMKLVGIVQGRQGPLAMVEGPDGLGYILRPGDAIGEGRVAEIGTDSVTIQAAGLPGQVPTRMVLRLKAE